LPSRLDPLDDPRNYDFPIGFGSAFVEFTSISESKRARKSIHLAKYNGRMVECAFHNEIKFEKNDFSCDETIKIEKPSGEFEGLERFAIDFNM